MPDRRPAILILVLVLLGGGYFTFRLLDLRFSRGDVYPAYSSMRADPLGTKVLHELIELYDDRDAMRNLEPISRYKGAVQQQTWLFLGAYPGKQTPFGPRLGSFKDFPQPGQEAAFAGLFKNGGRAVVAFQALAPGSWTYESEDANTPPSPSTAPNGSNQPAQSPSPNAVPPAGPLSPIAPGSPVIGGDVPPQAPDGSPTPQPGPGPATPPGATPIPIPGVDSFDPTLVLDPQGKVIWQLGDIRFAVRGPEEGEAMVAIPTAEAPAGAVSIPWHSILYFADLDESWRVLYTRDDLPVVVEQRSGRGSLVLISDAYPFSNESLLKHQGEALINWTIGDKPEIVFNETHLGMSTTPGIANLMRHYRLHGLAVGLLILALLFIWQSTSSLVPASALAGDTRLVRNLDRSAAHGMVNLLARHLPRETLVKACFEEWYRAMPPGFSAQSRRVLRAADLFAEVDSLKHVDRQPVKTYQAVCRILAEKDRPT